MKDSFNLSRFVKIGFTMLLLAAACNVSAKPDGAFSDKIQPIFQTYCTGCHGKDKQKGDIRFDKLDPDIVQAKDAETWQLVLDQLNLGDMPPKKAKKRPNDNERRALVNWLTASLDEAKTGLPFNRFENRIQAELYCSELDRRRRRDQG